MSRPPATLLRLSSVAREQSLRAVLALTRRLTDLLPLPSTGWPESGCRRYASSITCLLLVLAGLPLAQSSRDLCCRPRLVSKNCPD